MTGEMPPLSVFRELRITLRDLFVRAVAARIAGDELESLALARQFHALVVLFDHAGVRLPKPFGSRDWEALDRQVTRNIADNRDPFTGKPAGWLVE